MKTGLCDLFRLVRWRTFFELHRRFRLLPAVCVLKTGDKHFVGQHGHGHTTGFGLVVKRRNDEPLDFRRIMFWT